MRYTPYVMTRPHAAPTLHADCVNASNHTVCDLSSLHTGVNRNSRPCAAPSNVTARIAATINRMNSVGMRMRLVRSMPFTTPREMIQHPMARAIRWKSRGWKFPVVRFCQ